MIQKRTELRTEDVTDRSACHTAQQENHVFVIKPNCLSNV